MGCHGGPPLQKLPPESLTFWEVDGECTSLAQLRRDGHLAAMQQRQMLHNREPETCAAHISRTRTVDSIETLEQSLEMLRRDSITVVVNQNLVTRTHLVRDRDCAVLTTELNSV